jgi:hypothetical protein
VLSNDFYVDDLLSGTSALEEAIEMQQQLTTLLQTAGLQLRKWASNHSSLLDTIPKELQETQTLSLDNEDGVTTLGLLWDPTNDQLQVKSNFSKVQLTNSTVSTKRMVLATTAAIFDPLGLLSPAVIAYKIFLQKLWQDQMQWDEPLPIHLQEWNQLCQIIPYLSNQNQPEGDLLQCHQHIITYDSVTAANVPMKPASTFAPQITQTNHIVNFCVQLPRLHH